MFNTYNINIINIIAIELWQWYNVLKLYLQYCLIPKTEHLSSMQATLLSS